MYSYKFNTFTNMIFKNEPFLFIEPPQSLPGAGFILSTEPPFYIGRVIKMMPEEVQLFTLQTKKEYAFCKGFSIVVLGEGSLMSEGKTGQSVLIEMANFYAGYRNIENAYKYKRYRL